MTIQSNRPSSRSSQRSTGSISSYSGRRHSKGVSVSQSRQGQARSAAILLYSYHLEALRDQSSHSSESHLTYPKSSSSLSNEIMLKHIEQQIEEQKRMLFIDLPELRNHNTLMRNLRLLPRSEFDLTQLDKRFVNIRPLHRKLQRRFFNKFSSKKANVDDDDDDEDGGGHNFGGFNSNDDDDLDERSVYRSDGMFVNKSADMIEMAPLPPQLGYSNPLAFSFDDIDADGEEVESIINDEEFHRYFIDDEVFIIGALPTPTTSNGPSIAVCKIKTNSLSCDRCVGSWIISTFFILNFHS